MPAEEISSRSPRRDDDQRAADEGPTHVGIAAGDPRERGVAHGRAHAARGEQKLRVDGLDAGWAVASMVA